MTVEALGMTLPVLEPFGGPRVPAWSLTRRRVIRGVARGEGASCQHSGVAMTTTSPGRSAWMPARLLFKRIFMAAKPLIGINTDYRSTRKEHAALSFVAAGYYDGITAVRRHPGDPASAGR
jgi:hypothetical protein